MDNNQKPVNYSMVWFGFFAILMGIIPIFSALDIIPTDESSFHAPRWVVILAGFVFVSAAGCTAARYGGKMAMNLVKGGSGLSVTVDGQPGKKDMLKKATSGHSYWKVK